MAYLVNFMEIHHDPYQWPEPSTYCPDRFSHGDSKWNKTADGKPRHAFAFTPFFGGRRVCLGKTFAETTMRFTIPLIYYHLDFEFKDASQATHKENYAAAALDELHLPMAVKIRNKVRV